MNFCTYYSKGLADNVGIWDFDEFFIPKGENRDLLDVIEKASAPAPQMALKGLKEEEANDSTALSRKGRGWADENGHPFCYLQLK